MRCLIAALAALISLPALAQSPNPYSVGQMTYGTDLMQNQCGFAVSALFESGSRQSEQIDSDQFHAGYDAGPELWDKMLNSLGRKKFCARAIEEHGPSGSGHVYKP